MIAYQIVYNFYENTIKIKWMVPLRIKQCCFTECSDTGTVLCAYLNIIGW